MLPGASRRDGVAQGPRRMYSPESQHHPPTLSLIPTIGFAPSYPWNHQSGRSSLRERLSSGAEAQNAGEKGQVRGAEATSGIRVTEVEASGMAHRQNWRAPQAPQPDNGPDFESQGFQGWPSRWAVQELPGGWDLSQLRTMWAHEPLGAPTSRPACDQLLIRGHTSQASSWGGFPGWAG